MGEAVYRPNTTRMWTLLLPAVVYLALTANLPTLTGTALIDGSIGVVLGLYICSHPAANGIDLFFLQRGAVRQIASGWSGAGWLLLNALVMVVGWLVIVFGAAQFTARVR